MKHFVSLLLIFSLSSNLLPASSKPESQKRWWKESVFYQIYMPSFQDSNGDGYSDFRGMTDRLDYLQELGIKGIWLTPFLKSPKVDNGYDVADYYSIDLTYGNRADFRHFLAEAHKRGLKVIMDMVLNHTSTDSHWFQESRKSTDNPYRDYYVWREKPNNWESFFGGNAWQYDSLTNEYYLHKFDVRMADLNWTNPAVAAEVQQVLQFWLELGIDGFRFDVVNFFHTDHIYTDNPFQQRKQQAVYNINQPGIKKAIALLQETVNQYPDRFTVGEVGSDQISILRQFQSPDLLDVVFNFNFGSIPEFSVKRLFSELKGMEKNMPGYPTLFFGSHDNPRLMSRLANDDPQRALALGALMLFAKGVPFIYYGEEIGMQNIYANNYEEIVDIQAKTFYQLALDSGKTPEEALVEGNKHNRDKSRGPMQWNNGSHAGFTTGKPWIKIHDNAREINVESAQKNPESMLAVYKAMIGLRNKEKALQYGVYKKLTCKNDCISFTRQYEDSSITVWVNFGAERKVKIPREAEVLMGNATLKSNHFLVYRINKD
jgi:trehalose-6-phosphate hydrolase